MIDRLHPAIRTGVAGLRMVVEDKAWVGESKIPHGSRRWSPVRGLPQTMRQQGKDGLPELPGDERGGREEAHRGVVAPGPAGGEAAQEDSL